MSDFAWTIQLIYLLAASSFVFGLHLMNTPATARRGNQASTVGMAVAIAATLAIIVHDNLISTTGWIVMTAGALVGSALGLYSARNVQMTAMPQLVNTHKAAEILGRSAATLKRWRAEGVGPNWIELQGRVSYDVNVLLEFIQKNTRVASVRAAMEETREAV